MLKVVSAPRVISNCCDFDNFNELGGIAVKVHHVASFAGGLRAGVHGHTHIGLRQSRRIVGAVSNHGNQLAAFLFLTDAGQFVFRLGLGDEIVHARFRGDGGGGQSVVASDHNSLDTHFTELGKTFLDAAFNDVLEMDDAEALLPSATSSGVAPWRKSRQLYP